MKFIKFRKYRRLYAKCFYKKKQIETNYLVEGVTKLKNTYTYFDATCIIDKVEKGDHPVYCYSGLNLWGGVIVIDPEKAFNADYKSKDLVTEARIHCENIKKANIPLKQKRLMDFVLGVAHEVGHLRAGHARWPKPKEDSKEYQNMESEAEKEVLWIASTLYYKDKTWLDIIQGKNTEQPT